MTHLFLQAGGGSASYYNLIFMGLIFVVFYFFLIRPQSKQRKEGKAFQDSLAKGDDVVTASGILGRINSIDGDIVKLEIANKVFIQVTRNSISKDLTEAVHGNAE